MTSYYRLCDDMQMPDRWHLRAPVLPSGEEIDARLFTGGRPVDPPASLRLPLRQPGRPLDFTLGDFDMPVATRPLAEYLARLAPGSVQCVPVSIDGEADEFVILNVLRSVRCLDEASSKIQYWTAADGRPEKVGQYRMVLNETIDAQRAAGFDLFRLGGWEIVIVCTDRVKQDLEKQGFSGLTFIPLRTKQPGAAA